MATTDLCSVWVFTGENARFPSGVFASRAAAEAWISVHCLTGLLTKYPLDIGIYDWAIRNDHFRPKGPQHQLPKFIGSFSSASLDHVHFEHGVAIC